MDKLKYGFAGYAINEEVYISRVTFATRKKTHAQKLRKISDENLCYTDAILMKMRASCDYYKVWAKS